MENHLLEQKPEKSKRIRIPPTDTNIEMNDMLGIFVKDFKEQSEKCFSYQL